MKGMPAKVLMFLTEYLDMNKRHLETGHYLLKILISKLPWPVVEFLAEHWKGQHFSGIIGDKTVVMNCGDI